MSALFAAACGLLVAAALRELWAERGSLAAGRARRLLAGVVARYRPVPERTGVLEHASAQRLVRAGLDERIDPRLLRGARLLTGIAALPLALQLAPVAPGRLVPLVAVGLPLAAALLPDVLVARVARARAQRIGAALPESLELMAVGAGSGGGVPALLQSAAAGCRPSPLRAELLRASAEIECGARAAPALRRLGQRSGGDVAALAQLLDRSRRLGSPLAAGLQEQAAGLRDRQAREIEERAARAAPKIQLIVALLLVPSVLLLVGAAIIANAESLLSGL